MERIQKIAYHTSLKVTELGVRTRHASLLSYMNKFEEKMKYLLILLSFVTVVHAEPNWVMTKCSTPLSYYVDFECFEDDVLTDKIVRSGLFTPRYYYDLHSPEGIFLARAVNRVLSLGLFFTSQMEFDIYDENYAYAGYIGGKFWTHGQAKFRFTNAEGVETGTALLRSDSDQAKFFILSPTNSVVATLTGTLSGDFSKWELEVQRPLGIDLRALKIFTAFISDFHDSFIRKPEVNNYYYNTK